MTSKIKRVLKWSIIGLVIIAATVLVASQQLYTPKPPTTPAPTADEIAEAIRTCGVYGKPQEDRTTEIDGTVSLEECIQVNKECQALRGPHSVWSGTARSDFDEADNEQLIPNCKCDKGYEWLNTDGSIGVTSGTVVFNMIDGPGRCIVQQ